MFGIHKLKLNAVDNAGRAEAENFFCRQYQPHRAIGQAGAKADNMAVAERGKSLPNIKADRRAICEPASKFSDTTEAENPSGAIIGMSPSGAMTPRAPKNGRHANG